MRDNANWVTTAESHHKWYPTKAFPLELFSGDVKTMTEREERSDSVSMSFCSSIKIKGISGVLSPCLPTYLPSFLLQLLYTAQQLFCDAYIPPLCQNPLETRLPLVVIDCHALFIAPKDREEPACQSDWNKVHLKGLTVAGTTMACWSTDSAIHSRRRLNNSVATAALQFKYKVGPMAGDHNRRGRIGIQGVGEERDNS